MKIYTLLFYIFVLIVTPLCVYLSLNNKVAPRVGSISFDSSAYTSTSTDLGWNTTNNPSKFRTLKIGNGILGSAVISGTAVAGGLKFYDATTTVNGGIYATSTIAVINQSTPAGTYTFDVAFATGLVVEFPDTPTVPTTTITLKR